LQSFLTQFFEKTGLNNRSRIKIIRQAEGARLSVASFQKEVAEEAPLTRFKQKARKRPRLRRETKNRNDNQRSRRMSA